MQSIFNPDVSQPPGGFCISVFLIVRRDSSILVGKIAKPEIWGERWGLSVNRPERWRDKWQIPGTFLLIGEHPRTAADRIWRDQLELDNFNPSSSDPRIFASSGESSVRSGTIHSDLFFVYDIEYSGQIKHPDHFADLHFVEISKLSSLTFGRGHDEVLHLSGIY